MKPPRLPPEPPSPPPARGGLVPLALLLTPLLLAGAAHFLRHHDAPLPGCSFHRLTGLPCAFCGSTRALDALGGGHLWAALALNPLLVLACAASVLGGGWLLLARIRGRPAPAAPAFPRKVRFWAGVTLALVLLNWAYLLLFPR